MNATSPTNQYCIKCHKYWGSESRQWYCSVCYKEEEKNLKPAIVPEKVDEKPKDSDKMDIDSVTEVKNERPVQVTLLV